MRSGTVLGLLGPNGAGKTTTVRILTTLLRADGGRAVVAGVDVARDPAGVRRRIGLVGQSAAVDEVLSGRQNLVLFGRLYHLGASRAAGRGRTSCWSASAWRTRAASRSRSTRAACAAGSTSPPGLILSPAVLFLDEPTTGLDPRGRNEVWAAVRALVNEGVTVLLTTQQLEEADQLADRIAVIDRGRVIAEDTPAALKASLGGDWIDVVVHSADAVARAAALLRRVSDAEPEIDAEARRVSAPVADRMGALGAVVRELGEGAEDIALRRPTLDEVFLALTERRPATRRRGRRRPRRRRHERDRATSPAATRSSRRRPASAPSRSPRGVRWAFADAWTITLRALQHWSSSRSCSWSGCSSRS